MNVVGAVTTTVADELEVNFGAESTVGTMAC